MKLQTSRRFVSSSTQKSVGEYNGYDADDGVGRGDGRPRHGDLGPAAVLVQPLVLLQQHPPAEQLKGRPQHKARSGKVRIKIGKIKTNKTGQNCQVQLKQNYIFNSVNNFVWRHVWILDLGPNLVWPQTTIVLESL